MHTVQNQETITRHPVSPLQVWLWTTYPSSIFCPVLRLSLSRCNCHIWSGLGSWSLLAWESLHSWDFSSSPQLSNNFHLHRFGLVFVIRFQDKSRDSGHWDPIFFNLKISPVRIVSSPTPPLIFIYNWSINLAFIRSVCVLTIYVFSHKLSN